MILLIVDYHAAAGGKTPCPHAYTSMDIADNSWISNLMLGAKQSLGLYDVVAFPGIDARVFFRVVVRQKQPHHWPEHSQPSCNM